MQMGFYTSSYEGADVFGAIALGFVGCENIHHAILSEHSISFSDGRWIQLTAVNRGNG